MSTGSNGKWDEYDRWNDAIAEVIYPELEVPEPVYMDFEDEVLEELGDRIGISAAEVEDRLCSVVQATLGDGGPAQIFARHMYRLRQWQRTDRSGTPPYLGVLAVFCIAAERMAAGDGMSQANYFGRLREALGYDEDDRRIDNAYRRVAERLWFSLNQWLLDLDGRRGLPTAYALTFRFVGLTISQALVRKSDRERLTAFFRRYGFAPGAEVPPSELETVLDSWIGERPSPVTASLERLWRRGQARERIAQVAAVALSAWDGSVPGRAGAGTTGAVSTGGQLSLSLELGGFPRKRFNLQVLLYLQQPGTPRDGLVLTSEDQATVELVPDIQGALGLGRSSSLHADDVLGGVLRIKDTLTDAVLERRPRRLVVFRQDELTRRWIETQHALLGDSLTLVVHVDLVPRLEKVLSEVARPGWEVHTQTYAGQPEKWAVVTGVEIFGTAAGLISSSTMDDLSPLLPLTKSQLKVAGGFALPGQVRGKWHSWYPPEIRAVSDVDGGFAVRLVDLGVWAEDSEEEPEETVLEEWYDDGAGVVVAPLSGLELQDGDYRVELVRASDGETLSTTTVRLRSSDMPDRRQWALAEGISYLPATGSGTLGVMTEERGPVVAGHTVTGVARLPVSIRPVPGQPWWATTRRSPRQTTEPLRLTMPDPESCIYTGRHKEIVETVPVDAKGKPLVAWSYGKCSGCGLVRRYPTRLRPAWRGRGRKAVEEEPAAPRRDVSSLEAVDAGSTLDWEVALDALLHTGGGPWSQLERIALQLEPTSLFVDQFARTLEVLGHVDVRRDARTLAPTAWEVAPTALAGTEDGALFSGYWPSALWQSVAQQLENRGTELTKQEQEGGPASYFAHGTVELLMDAVKATGESDIAGVQMAWEDLVATLPPLSEVADALPRSDASVTGSVKWFVPADNQWVDAADTGAVGGYRVTRFSTLDFVRTDRDLAGGTIAHSTVQLSKHVAALLTARPMLAYRQSERQLVVPLGADLPALYGRAVVAASGRVPSPDLAHRLLIYHDVPPALASHIYDLFSS